jgi:cytochrome c oxidase subunit 2
MSLFIAMLTLQNFVGIISLAGALIVASVVVFLIVTSSKIEDKASLKNKFYKIRGRSIFGIILFLLIILIITFQLWPYSQSRNKADEIISVVGIQWDWEMAHGIINKTPHEFLGRNEISIPVNKRIKFIVTSDDVIHNFGIYNSKGELLTQVQAMPQYKNELQYIFTQKGDYTILCLEYCGLAHPFMTGIIHVR